MKFYYSLLVVLVVSFATHAQKKELKSVQKLVDGASYEEALSSLSAVQSLIENAEAKYVSQYYYLLGVSKQGTKAFSEAIAAFDKAKDVELEANSKKYTSLINAASEQLVNEIIQYSDKLYKSEKYIEASKLFYLAYTLNKESYTDFLYFAATSAVSGSNYVDALKYYLILKDLNYSGSVKKYYVTEVSSGEEMEVDESTYKIYKKSKDFTNLREEMTPSRLPEIVKNIALIHLTNGDNEAAMAAVKDARKLSPKDVGLILTEADLYNKLGDEVRFATLMEEAIQQDPNNVILYYNLGVVNANKGNRDIAMEYYKKAIELDSTYEPTYLNLASVILEGEAAIVEEMNSLGTSSADNRKYDVLKAKREGLFLEAVPYLEELVKINPSNKEALTTLKNIFGTIGDTVKFRKYRDMLEAL